MCAVLQSLEASFMLGGMEVVIPKKHVYEVLIREHHLDSFGHVNNAVYMELFEEGRWELLADSGWGYDEIHKSKFGIAILEAQIRFSRELRLREKIRIETALKPVQGKIGEIEQVMRDPEGVERARANFKYGIFDRATRQLIQPNPEWLGVVEKYRAE